MVHQKMVEQEKAQQEEIEKRNQEDEEDEKQLLVNANNNPDQKNGSYLRFPWKEKLDSITLLKILITYMQILDFIYKSQKMDVKEKIEKKIEEHT